MQAADANATLQQLYGEPLLDAATQQHDEEAPEAAVKNADTVVPPQISEDRDEEAFEVKTPSFPLDPYDECRFSHSHLHRNDGGSGGSSTFHEYSSVPAVHDISTPREHPGSYPSFTGETATTLETLDNLPSHPSQLGLADTWTLHSITSRRSRSLSSLLARNSNDLPLGQWLQLISTLSLKRVAFALAMNLPHLMTLFCLLLGPPPNAVLESGSYVLGACIANLVCGIGVYFSGGMDWTSTEAVGEEKFRICWKQLIKCCCVTMWYFILAATAFEMFQHSTGVVTTLFINQLQLTQVLDVERLFACGLLGDAFFETFQRFLAYQTVSAPQFVIGISTSLVHCAVIFVIARCDSLTPVVAAALFFAAGAARGIMLGSYVVIQKYELGWQSGVRVRLYQRERPGLRRRLVRSTSSLHMNGDGVPARRSRRIPTRRPSASLPPQKASTGAESSRKRFRIAKSGDASTKHNNNNNTAISTSSKRLSVALGGPEPPTVRWESSLSVELPHETATERKQTDETTDSENHHAQSFPAPHSTLFSMRRLSRRVASGENEADMNRDCNPAGLPQRRTCRERTVVSVRSVSVDNRLVIDGFCCPTTKSFRVFWDIQRPRQIKETLEFLKLAIPSTFVLSQEWLTFELVVVLGMKLGPISVVVLGLCNAFTGFCQAFTIGIVCSVTNHIRLLIRLDNRERACRVLQVTGLLLIALLSGLAVLIGFCAYLIRDWHPPSLIATGVDPLTTLFTVLALITIDSAAMFIAGMLWCCGVTALFPLELMCLGVLLPVSVGLGVFVFHITALQILHLEIFILTAFALLGASFLIKCSPLNNPDASLEAMNFRTLPLFRARRGFSECRGVLFAELSKMADRYQDFLEESRSATLEYMRDPT